MGLRGEYIFNIAVVTAKGLVMSQGSGASAASAERVFKALDGFRIEVPSWGFANTGTRFGKFAQAGAATTLEEKFSDAGEVNKLTGASPTVALHVLWDLPNGKGDVAELLRL
jgi:L-rhamnose isomerase/sugar isomerase